MNAIDILDRLIAFPSVVGTPNGAIVEWISEFLAAAGARVTVLPGPEGDRANLFATIGPSDRRGYILSGHMDVVPATEPSWTSDPFKLRNDGGRLVGRGATDMKGFLAAALHMATKLSGMALTRPIHFAFSYDEEAACRGVPHMLKDLPKLCEPPLGAIIGEPSGMVPILAHKGKAAVRATITGRPGHSSRPDLGLNAIHAAARVMQVAHERAAALAQGPFDEVFAPPYSSLQVGTVRGGSALNIVPDHCEFELEARAIAGVDPTALLAPVRTAFEALRNEGYGIEWEEMSAYPGLSLSPDAALAGLVSGLVGAQPIAAVSYGTEAGLFQHAGVDAIICGPGDIARAHKPDEFLLVDELESCIAMMAALVDSCCR